MSTALVSLRGYNSSPVLLIVDLDSLSVIRTLEPNVPSLDHIPDSKVGFTGIAKVDSHHVAAALWDRVVILNVEDGTIAREITDSRFSDLHSIHIEESGNIWVSNTNLDGIYRIDGEHVCAVWHAWECPNIGRPLKFQPDDYRLRTKDDIPYHTYHVNSVFVDQTTVVCSFLGQKRRRSRMERYWCRAFPDIRWGPVFSGGYFVIRRDDGALLKTVRCEGLHDAKNLKDGGIWSTQYFGRSLVRLDPHSLEIRTLPLEADLPHQGGYLTRGLLEVEDGYWVGHTVPRGWKNPSAIARLRKYDRSGKRTYDEIELPGYVGVYDIVPL